jgi:hypothetical protein
MAAFWDDVRFFAGKTEAEAQGFEADGALGLVVYGVVIGHDWDGSSLHR